MEFSTSIVESLSSDTPVNTIDSSVNIIDSSEIDELVFSLKDESGKTRPESENPFFNDMSLETAMNILMKAFPEEDVNIVTETNIEEIPKTIEELRSYILKRLYNRQVEDESIPILHLLIQINQLGLITFESQPSDAISQVFSDGSFWSKRAYLNGLFPRKLVAKLATALHGLNSRIVVSETVLNEDPSKDHLNLFNFTKDNVPLIHGLYPMARCCNGNEILNWYSGYSGNISFPMLREYIHDHFFQVPLELTQQIVGNYSLIQIWSQNINDNIFPTISQALSNL